MSTQFRTQQDAQGEDSFAFQRWCSRSGPCLEFLTRANARRVFDLAMDGATFLGETGETFGLGDLMEFFARDAWTFGRGPVTLEADEAFGFEWDQAAERNE